MESELIQPRWSNLSIILATHIDYGTGEREIRLLRGITHEACGIIWFNNDVDFNYMHQFLLLQ